MRREARAAIGVLASVYLLMGSAVCISISVQSDIGGFNQEIGAGIDDSVFSQTVISSEAMSTRISASGNFKDKHRISDALGQMAEIGVNIKNAQWYDYGYTLGNGDGYASACESLDVINARDIKAYASALNAHGDESSTSISISDNQGMASLEGYSNYAQAKSEAEDVHSSVARQQFAAASGNNIRIDERSSQADGSSASASMAVFDGYVDSYFGESIASKGMHEEVYELDGSVFSKENWDRAEAGHKANIQGEIINIFESAYQEDGDRAQTWTWIEDGNTAGYEGKSRVGISHRVYQGYYGYLFNEMSDYADATHTISSMEGRKLALLEGSIMAEGDMATTSLIAEGSAEMYDGSSSATTNNYTIDYGQGYVAEVFDDDAESSHRGTLNDNDGKALIKNWGRSAEGDFSFVAIDSHNLSLAFDGYAFGGDRSSIFHEPDGTNTVRVGDGSTAIEMVELHPPVYNLYDSVVDVRARAISSDGIAHYQSDKINAEEMGEMALIDVSAQVYEGNPETRIFF